MAQIPDNLLTPLYARHNGFEPRVTYAVNENDV